MPLIKQFLSVLRRWCFVFFLSFGSVDGFVTVTGVLLARWILRMIIGECKNVKRQELKIWVIMLFFLIFVFTKLAGESPLDLNFETQVFRTTK